MASNPRQSPRASANARWADRTTRHQYNPDPRIDPAAFGPEYWARRPEGEWRAHYALLIESGDDLRAEWLRRAREKYRARYLGFASEAFWRGEGGAR